MKIKTILALCVASALSACASSYTSSTLTGGYTERALLGDAWQIQYSGNGFTSDETVQTYWLYHCAEFTLSKGFDGFTIVSPVNLSAIGALHGPERKGEVIRVRGSSGGGMVFVPYSTEQMYKPWITANIQMLHKPFVAVPGKTFDAAALKALLGPHVLGPKCDGNVGPYVHTYLFPPAPAGT